MATVTIQPAETAIKDTFVKDLEPDNNWGTNATMDIGFRPANNEKDRAYIQFDLSEIPQGSTITSAVLSIYGYVSAEGVSANQTLACHLVTASWDESTITWNTQPAFGVGALTTVGPFASNDYDWRAFTITTTVQAWLDYTTANYGVVIKQNNEGSTISTIGFHSSAYAVDTSLRPKLVVEYTPPAFVPIVTVIT